MRLLPILLALLLTAGCVLSPTWRAPRERPEPGDIVIPRMAEPMFDRGIGLYEWADAQEVDGEFFIDSGTPSDGHYPFRMWLGADEQALFIRFTFPNISVNPYSQPHPASGNSVWYPDALDLFFTQGRQGPLTQGSYWMSISNGRELGSSTDDGYWTGAEWILDNFNAPSSFQKGKPTGVSLGLGGYTDEGFFWEIYIPREPPNPQHNAVDFRGGGVFRMCLVFEREGSGQGPGKAGLLFADPHDAWPRPGYSPDDFLSTQNWTTLYLGF